MKIAELRARENYDDQLKQMMQQCYALNQKMDGLSTVDLPAGESDSWYEHPFFSVYVTREFCASGRRYLCSLYRHSPGRARRIAQAAAVEAMAVGPVFRQMLRPAFELSKMENAGNCMWMPGNHRFRCFDFERRTVRVFPKAGFSRAGIAREISIRNSYAGRFDWMLPVSKVMDDEGCFEEPLLDTHPLNRESNQWRRGEAEKQAMDAMHALHAVEARVISSAEYLELKCKEFESARVQMHKVFPGVRFEQVEALWQRAVQVVRRSLGIDICMTHGDFQPGNILMSDEVLDHIWLIDWEDAGIRAAVYDEMTYLLESRHPCGLAQRVQKFIGLWEGSPIHCSRETAIALWVIEEIIWQLESSSRAGIKRLPNGVCQFFQEIGGIRF